LRTENDDGTFSFEFNENVDRFRATGDVNEFVFQITDDDLNPASPVDEFEGIEGLCPGDWGQDPSVDQFMTNFFNDNGEQGFQLN
jgi:hypothetical protein